MCRECGSFNHTTLYDHGEIKQITCNQCGIHAFMEEDKNIEVEVYTFPDPLKNMKTKPKKSQFGKVISIKDKKLFN